MGPMVRAISTFLCISAALCFVAGCAGPSVNLSTNEPIKVDINMKLDVYQHGEKTPKVSASTKAASDELPMRRRNRMGELQLLKDSRLIGENHLGLLTVRNEPPGEYGNYVQRTVEAENRDRETEMQRIAKERNISIEDLRRETAKLTCANAFNGEWIEVPQTDGSYAWIKKGN
jgi:uncharacterized protein YdbL (DUF1318 family)